MVSFTFDATQQAVAHLYQYGGLWLSYAAPGNVVFLLAAGVPLLVAALALRVALRSKAAARVQWRACTVAALALSCAGAVAWEGYGADVPAELRADVAELVQTERLLTGNLAQAAGAHLADVLTARYNVERALAEFQ